MVRPRLGRVIWSQKSRTFCLQGLCSKYSAVGSLLGVCWLQLVSISVSSNFTTHMQMIPAPFPFSSRTSKLIGSTEGSFNGHFAHNGKSHSIHSLIIGRLAGLEVLAQRLTSQIAAGYHFG